VSSVLVVDDDATVAEVVTGYLTRAGFDTAWAGDGASALSLAESMHPDLVVLDVMLPGVDGLEVCRRLRSTRPGLAVVMLSALGDEDDRVLGLQVGADDYVAKPFSPRELVLRVQSVLRRAETSQGRAAPTAPVRDGDLEIDVAGRRATRSGSPLALTTREFDLLVFFVTHSGTAFTREQLMGDVWGWEFGDRSTVTVHVRRLREKVEVDPSAPSRLTTVWGHGYRWDATDPL
jgi:DNA-binding response OmpR family regulator